MPATRHAIVGAAARLFAERGWSEADVAAWLEDLLGALLLPPGRPYDA
jgi:hypothetical protein